MGVCGAPADHGDRRCAVLEQVRHERVPQRNLEGYEEKRMYMKSLYGGERDASPFHAVVWDVREKDAHFLYSMKKLTIGHPYRPNMDMGRGGGARSPHQSMRGCQRNMSVWWRRGRMSM